MEKAKRNPVGYRYDLLDVEFLKVMAFIGHYGAITYGEGNWMKSRLTGGEGPINHIYKHLEQYTRGTAYDHKEIGVSPSIHLAAIAFNAMMEFYYTRLEESGSCPTTPVSSSKSSDS